MIPCWEIKEHFHILMALRSPEIHTCFIFVGYLVRKQKTMDCPSATPASTDLQLLTFIPSKYLPLEGEVFSLLFIIIVLYLKAVPRIGGESAVRSLSSKTLQLILYSQFYVLSLKELRNYYQLQIS